MISTNILDFALNNVKVGDRIVITSEDFYNSKIGVIVINSKFKYNVWFDEDGFGDGDWYDDLQEMIKGYWETWSNHGESIRVELY